MKNIKVLHSHTGEVIFDGDITNLENADLRYANLENADLRYANLENANLRYANLENANLRYANLGSANLRYANLGSANLRNADLRNADLWNADLWNANLRNANLRNAKINWHSHGIMAEILRQAAGYDWQKRSLAGLILVSPDWCWREFQKIKHPLAGWAMEVFSRYKGCPLK